MAIRYHVYSNDLAGGPVDYGTPVADVATPGYVSAPLPFGSDATFAVRAYDDVTGLEEKNIQARVNVVTGPAGEDLSDRPSPVPYVAAYGRTEGVVFVAWPAAPFGPPPDGYRVYAGTPAVSYASPVATVAFAPLTDRYGVELTGLTPGATYEFAVVAYRGGATATGVVASAVSPGPAPPAPEGVGAAAWWAEPS